MPVMPPLAPSGGINLPSPDVGTASTTQYSLHPRNTQGQVIGPSRLESLNSFLIYMFQDAPNSYWEAINSPEKDKWPTEPRRI